MDYYQGVVTDYLRANRATFVNTEYCLQLNPKSNPDTSGPHWYCDAVALDFNNPKTVFLCEISYEKNLTALCKRLSAWHENWEKLCVSVQNSTLVDTPKSWRIRPWLFVPSGRIPFLVKKLEAIEKNKQRLFPRITPLEMVQPWEYRSWDRQGEGPKPNVPEAMRE